MPVLIGCKIPKPKSGSEFEQISLSSFKIRWNNPNLQLNGRNGQSQHGVDIIGDDNCCQPIGIQCKNVVNFSEKEIDAEISLAEKSSHNINCLYFSISIERDVKLLALVKSKSKKRINQGKFALAIYFWDDIIEELLKNEAEFQLHYPQLSLKGSLKEKFKGNRLLSIIDYGYYYKSINNYMNLIFGEMGKLVNEDPLQFEKIIMTIESTCNLILDSNLKNSISSKLQKIREYVMPWVLEGADRPEGWKPVEILVKQLETELEKLEYLLNGKELKTLIIGSILARWNCLVEEPTFCIKNKNKRYLLKLIFIVTKNIKLVFDVNKKIKYMNQTNKIENIHIPHEIYNKVRNHIILAN